MPSLQQRRTSATENLRRRVLRSELVGEISRSSNASIFRRSSSRTVAGLFRSKSAMSSSSSEVSGNFPEISSSPFSNDQLIWRLDEETGSSTAIGGASWESSTRSELIDYKSLFRVKLMF